MTNHEPQGAHAHPPPPEAQEDMSINSVKIVAVAITALVVFALATWWSAGIYEKSSKALQPNGPDPIPAVIGSPQIGLVEQVPFELSRMPQQYQAERRKRLETWGWIDPKTGAIHMPIERAMEQVVQESKK
jgi:hypothetical protein